MKGWFVTGTDTSVGKTVLSALLLAELRRRGLSAAYFKPVQTGCRSRPAKGRQTPNGMAPDLEYVKTVAAWKITDADGLRFAPFRFGPACSPHLAAEMAGTELSVEKLAAAVRKEAKNYEWALVEGAGGILVPINRRQTMRDLMVALDLPVVLAARPGLGTLNHTLLSLEALRKVGLKIAGVALMEAQRSKRGAIERDNPKTLAQMGGIPRPGLIPYSEKLGGKGAPFSRLPPALRTAIQRLVDEWPA